MELSLKYIKRGKHARQRNLFTLVRSPIWVKKNKYSSPPLICGEYVPRSPVIAGNWGKY